METIDENWFVKECSELATLETFDPAAFVADDNVPQSLCNFVLTLSLIFNDLRDLYYANVLVGECRPKGLPQRSRQWGYYSGLNLHVLRLMMSAVHELLNLIDKQKEDVDHPLLRDVVKGLPKDRRSDWCEVVKVGLGNSSTDEKLGKLLLRMRNNISFHYDPKAVHAGFKNHFFAERVDGRAYISRGDSVEGSRFYFADASVEGLLREISGSQSADLATQFAKLLNSVSFPLILIVGGFIQKRGFGFRSEG
jgi:hypothetical protein